MKTYLSLLAPVILGVVASPAVAQSNPTQPTEDKEARAKAETEIKEAVRLYREVVKTDPTPLGRLGLARCLIHSGEKTEAAETSVVTRGAKCVQLLLGGKFRSA